MPYSVSQLMEGKPAPISTSREEALVKALRVMIEHDYSQLPVIDENNFPTGMITYESILRGMKNFQTRLDDLHVRDVMVGAPTFYIEDNLFELLAQLKLSNAVLIVTSENKLTGILTSYDATEYFRNRSENLMRIEDIEEILKDFILWSFSDEDGSIDDQKLWEAIAYFRPKGQKLDKRGILKSFDELSLGQYISIVIIKQTWTTFEPIFKIPRDSLRKLLDEVRYIRNLLAHFKGEISTEQSDQLRFCADWLARCHEEFEQNITQELFQKLVETRTSANKDKNIVREETQAYTVINNSFPPISMETQEHPSNENRYTQLLNWLKNQTGDKKQIQLSFEQIEELIGGCLPKSAYTHRWWWAYEFRSRIWLETGWRCAYPNTTEKRVTFVRI